MRSDPALDPPAPAVHGAPGGRPLPRFTSYLQRRSAPAYCTPQIFCRSTDRSVFEAGKPRGLHTRVGMNSGPADDSGATGRSNDESLRQCRVVRSVNADVGLEIPSTPIGTHESPIMAK